MQPGDTIAVDGIDTAGSTVRGTLTVLAVYHDDDGRELLDLGRNGTRLVCGYATGHRNEQHNRRRTQTADPRFTPIHCAAGVSHAETEGEDKTGESTLDAADHAAGVVDTAESAVSSV